MADPVDDKMAENHARIEAKMAADQARVEAAVKANIHAMGRGKHLTAQGVVGPKTAPKNEVPDKDDDDAAKVRVKLHENQVKVTPKDEPKIYVRLNEKPIFVKSMEH